MNLTVPAHIRIQTIDRCLRSEKVYFSWSELAKACLKAVNTTEKEVMEPSRRTIMTDIKNMRSGKLGYEAPIQYLKNKGFYYSKRSFSIYNTTIRKVHISELRQSLHIIRDITASLKLDGIHDALSAIEESLNIPQQLPTECPIYLEHSLNEPGQRWISQVYRYIQSKQTMRVHYQPFDRPAELHLFSPHFIKEYSNRWYMIGYLHEPKVVRNLAMDRIVKIEPSIQDFEATPLIDHDEMYRYIYGVTIESDKTPEIIQFIAKPLLAKYLKTKPIHPTQKIIAEENDGVIFELIVNVNYEIRGKLLSYGDDVEVLAPMALRQDLENTAIRMAHKYQNKLG